MFTPVPVGFPPSDCNAVFGFCYAAQVYQRLKYECGLPIEEVYFPQEGGGSNFCAIRVSDGASQEAIWEMLQEAAANSDAKYVMAVDYDVNLRDSQLLIWALSFRSQPDEDVRVIPAGKRRFDASATHRSGRLDPSAAPIRANGSDGGSGGRKEFFLTLINATRKYPYPPVALPRKEYMERAIQLWNAQEVLPTPRLQEPWHGYLLGYWNEDLQEDADFIVQGQYAKAGAKSAKLQRKVRTPLLPLPHRGRGLG
jgi:4-hydroxy-3-polyprenylbenzoate decarboxylase